MVTGALCLADSIGHEYTGGVAPLPRRGRLTGALGWISIQSQGGAQMVDVGQQAPDFELPAHNGDRVALSQFKGQKWVIVSVYPAAFTSG